MDTVHNITRMVIRILIVMITAMLIYSLAEFIFLAVRIALTQHAAFSFSPEPIDKTKVFLSKVQELISAILLLTILIELIYSLVEYLKVGSTNYVRVITEIALIAIVRHLLALNFEHVQADVLLALSALIFVLGLFYLVISKRIMLKALNTNEKNSDETTSQSNQ